MVDVSAVESFADYDIALSDVPWPAEWAAKGRCRAVPTNLFFPGRGEDATAAQKVCARCPVLDECRVYALSHSGLTGVWAGLTGRDRRRLRHEALAVVPEPPAAPRPHNRAGTLYRTLQELATTPGRWARVGHFAAGHSAAAMASQLRRGHLPSPPGRWRFEGRANDKGGSDLYAYLDDKEA